MPEEEKNLKKSPQSGQVLSDDQDKSSQNQETVKESLAKTASKSQPSLNGPFPAELNHWNWGAFFLTWIWSIGNSVWIGLLAIISPIGLIMAIILGIKGNEWAWQNRKFESLEQFKLVQRKWLNWGITLFCVSFLIFPIIIISSLSAARNKASELQTNQNSNIAAQLNSNLNDNNNLNSNLNENSNLDSSGSLPTGE